MDSPQQALDALQREINLILEQTGRLFAAASQPTPEAALARASRLKHQLPVSNNRFHQALDVLDEKLQFTKVVMRRDLAVARSKSSTEISAMEAEPLPVAQADPPETNVAQADDAAADVIDMTEPDPPQPETTKETEDPPVTSPKKRPSPSHEDGSSEEPALKKQAMGDDAPVKSEPKASDTKLELNTNPSEQAGGEQSADEKAPDTATFSNTGDLDSLFNDATSAGGMGGEGGDEPDFSTSADLNAEFDFNSFNDTSNSNDNDNISTLLPGLQDYANDTTGTEPDFSSFFTTDPANNMTDQSQTSNTAMGQQLIDTAQGDSTFDDLFDMTFDMGGGNDGNQNGGNQFDFDFS